ncbi:ATP-binding protein [Dactylosporangium sp. NPDC049525]|uniref:sensor histidine kinase n=1 Tax=Dactylosporangium sp. NPDC049525 TaxID=3154730 RepID=UPI003437D3D8
MPKPIAVTLRRQFVWLVIVLLSVGAARFLGGQYLGDVYDGQLRRIADAGHANQRMLQDLTDTETGVRGYQLTGDPQFLAPFRAGAADYPLARAAALRAAPDDRTRVLVRDQDQLAQQWLAQVALPISALPPGYPGIDAHRSARGKELFDAIRAANAAVATAVEAAQRAAASSYRTASTVLEAALALLALLSVLVALRIHRAAKRMLLEPLAALQDLLDRRAFGDLTARAAVAGPPEVHRLATALNAGLDETGRARERIVAAADAVAAQKAYLDQVLDVIEVAVLTCDTDGRIVHLNRVARSRRADGVPQTIADLDPVHLPGTGAADPRPHPLARALAGDTVTAQEMALVGAAGERRVVADARPLRDAAGQVIGAVLTGYDVTDLREREADLAAFAAIAAHDLRSPLTAVSGYTEILADGLTDPDDVAVVTRIGSGVERMRRLIDDLLAYATARDAPLEPAPVDLSSLIASISPAVRLAGPLPVLDADAAMMRRLFENLIGNALKYTPPGRPADVCVSAAPSAGGGVHLTVADRGIGIPAEQRGRVFTSFHRAHGGHGYTGTGLGLAICQRVVARHGGTISAADNPGGGTCIHIDLPAACVAQPVGS